ALTAEAIGAGAIGFATSKSPAHAGAYGKPVPSRFAERSEIFEIAGALKDCGRGVFAATVGPGLYVDRLSELAQRIDRPVTWTALSASATSPTAKETLERQDALSLHSRQRRRSGPRGSAAGRPRLARPL